MSLYLRALSPDNFNGLLEKYFKDWEDSKTSASEILEWTLTDWIRDFLTWLLENDYAILIVDSEGEEK